MRRSDSVIAASTLSAARLTKPTDRSASRRSKSTPPCAQAAAAQVPSASRHSQAGGNGRVEVDK